MKTLFCRLLGVKKRNEIRHGKLWTITRVMGFDLFKVETPPAEPAPFVKPEARAIDKMTVHVIKSENNVTNLTKNPELL